MRLQPSEPPGNARKKLRSYSDEIARLRAEGYTLRVIHKTLLDAGVDVSWTTVQREVVRLARAHDAVKLGSMPDSDPVTPTALPTEDLYPKRSKVGVDEFFATHNANPLFNKKVKNP